MYVFICNVFVLLVMLLLNKHQQVSSKQGVAEGLCRAYLSEVLEESEGAEETPLE